MAKEGKERRSQKISPGFEPAILWLTVSLANHCTNSNFAEGKALLGKDYTCKHKEIDYCVIFEK